MLPGPREAQRVHPNVTLAVLSLAALAYAVLSSAVIPALPALQRSLHASETGVTWLLTAFLLSASVGTAIIGKLGDMYGKQRLVWTLLALAAGTLLAALSGSHSISPCSPPVHGPHPTRCHPPALRHCALAVRHQKSLNHQGP
ncbi:MAG: MFS transporter [Micromonosporaceae bacterium]